VSIITLIIVVTILISLFYYLTYSEVSANNAARKVTAALTAQSVIDKIDRNFYERFGDVQAFAYNRLAVQTASMDSVVEGTQEFINTMTVYYVLYDLMMIVDREGKALAVNTVDKNGNTLNTREVFEERFASEPWFISCTSADGPSGGAWYSDFMTDAVIAKIYNSTGHGMAFAAPIKSDGKVVGVWLNFASWNEVTEDIRKEAEADLLKDYPGSFVLITKDNGEVISSGNNELMHSSLKGNNEALSLSGNQSNLDLSQFEHGIGTSKGAYTYKGKSWKAFVFIPETKMSWSVFFTPRNLIICFILLAIVSAITLYVYSFFRQNILNRIRIIGEAQEKLSEGEIVTIPDLKAHSEDELGKILQSLKTLTLRLTEKAAFADEISRGNLNAELADIGSKDVLGNSLLNMRDQLKISSEADKQRNWTAEGLAQIGSILRSFQSSADLYQNIIQFTVRYLKANQGGLFLLKESEAGDRMLSLEACYAYEKRKFIDKSISPGEGLIGQCILEKETLYLTDIPSTYIRITSGLGDALPSSLLIIPLKINEEVYGALEIASFSKFSPHEISFAEKLAESIASSVSTVRNNEKTKLLVEQLQQQTEEMKAQEEEMRQNMEELAATQEEMLRKEKEYIQQINGKHAEKAL
jgi:GAF domain-containing protein